MKTQIVPTVLTLLTVATGCSGAPESSAARAGVAQAAPAPPVTWAIESPSAPITSSPARVRVHGHISSGWHIYSTTQPAGGPVATRITLPQGQRFVESGPPKSLEAPIVTYDDAFRMKVEVHDKDIDFVVPVRAVSPANSGDSLHINVRYQVCNDSLCYPAQTAHLAAAVPAGHA